MFLDAITGDERRRLLEGATTEQLPIRRVLFEPHQHIDRVHFPTGGIVSLVTEMSDGGIIEMATIGREGIVGVPMVLDGQSMPNARAISQVKGGVISAPAEAFVELVTGGGRFAQLVNMYMNALFTAVGQNAACNRLHSMTERCARWLLMTRDRVGSDSFELTHEFLSQMLGARRASVTEAAQTLQGIDAITYHRGVVDILDGAALEGRSCECYAVVQKGFARLY